MMREQDFYENVRESVARCLPEQFKGAEVTLTRQIKNNDTEKMGLTIRRPEEIICPVIYLEEFYQEYTKGVSMDAVVGKIVDLRVNLPQDPPELKDFSLLTNYDRVKPMLQMRVFDTEKNEKRLEGIVHHSYGDYSSAYCILLSDDKEKSMSVMITPPMLETWGITKRQLHEDTIEADLNRGPVFAEMASIMDNIAYGEECENFLNEETPLDPEKITMPLFVLTSDTRTHGAGLILNPVIQEKIAALLGGDYYVLPSSIHEIIIVPERGGNDAKELGRMVRDVNESMVPPEEVLSDKVQFYDSKTHCLVNAAIHEMDMEKRNEKTKAKSL